jgi:hypothetical protein
MIAKHIPREKGRSDFKHLVEYLLNEAEAGSRVGDVRLTNCDAEAPDGAIVEVLATQGMNVRAKGDPTYHLMVSFPPNERSAAKQLRDIEDELCAAIGLRDHQRISVVHIDRDHLHFHVAINKVHPESFNLINPYYDKKRLMKACDRLEAKHGLTLTNHGAEAGKSAPGRAGDMEAHTGETSLLGWIKKYAAADVVAAIEQGTGWRDLHAALNAHGLEIKPRGAGLVIAQRDGGVHVKASSVDRRISLKALTRRWGAFEAAVVALPTPASAPEGERPEQASQSLRYERGPRQPGAVAKKLYAEFQSQRAAALEARNAAFAQRREARAQSGGRPESASAITTAHPLPTWLGFLQTGAARGDADALATLRWRDHRQQRATQALLTAESPEEARHVVFTNLQPYVRRNGALVYRVRDGGVVVDESRQVSVEKISAHATFLALSLASERFAGQALIVEGTPEFKRQAVEMAAAQRIDVRFADPAMEAERKRLMAAAAKTQAPASAAENYVAQRNALRERVPSIDSHRLWTPEDAGDAIYQGRRRFADGSEAILLKKDGHMLVKPATTDQIKNTTHWNVGQTVVTDNQGQFVGARRARRR